MFHQTPPQLDPCHPTLASPVKGLAFPVKSVVLEQGLRGCSAFIGGLLSVERLNELVEIFTVVYYHLLIGKVPGSLSNYYLF